MQISHIHFRYTLVLTKNEQGLPSLDSNINLKLGEINIFKLELSGDMYRVKSVFLFLLASATELLGTPEQK